MCMYVLLCMNQLHEMSPPPFFNLSRLFIIFIYLFIYTLKYFPIWFRFRRDSGMCKKIHGVIDTDESDSAESSLAVSLTPQSQTQQCP